MKATTILRNEHDVILTALRVLTGAADRLAKGNREEREIIGELLGFFREFMDDTHHAKEEKVLFPALIQAGLPERMGPIAVMLHEHDVGRAHLGEMRTLLPRAVEDPIAAEELRHGAGEFSLLLENHIAKENGVLFAMAERMIADERELLVAFAAHEQQAIGNERYQHWIRRIGELGARYRVEQLARPAHCGC